MASGRISRRSSGWGEITDEGSERKPGDAMDENSAPKPEVSFNEEPHET
jgi:hypothetical protein